MGDGTERPSRWIPMTNFVDLAHLGKLGEEAAELSGIIERIQIQGIDECDPETGKVNRLALQEEIADVDAMSDLCIRRFGLNRDEIKARVVRKIDMKLHWHGMLNDCDPVEVLRKYITNQITSGAKAEFTKGELAFLREVSK